MNHGNELLSYGHDMHKVQEKKIKICPSAFGFSLSKYLQLVLHVRYTALYKTILNCKFQAVVSFSCWLLCIMVSKGTHQGL